MPYLHLHALHSWVPLLHSFCAHCAVLAPSPHRAILFSPHYLRVHRTCITRCIASWSSTTFSCYTHRCLPPLHLATFCYAPHSYRIYLRTRFNSLTHLCTRTHWFARANAHLRAFGFSRSHRFWIRFCLSPVCAPFLDLCRTVRAVGSVPT